MRSLIAARDLQRHRCLMGRESTQHATPDLFSTGRVREASAASTKSVSNTAARIPPASQRYVLPKNLDFAVRQLTDDELMQLLEVALQEVKQRGKSPLRAGGDPMQSSRQTEEVAQKHSTTENTSNRKQVAAEVTLSPGKLNAVRAAFGAGVTPSRIARQFGISQANVRKALAARVASQGSDVAVLEVTNFTEIAASPSKQRGQLPFIFKRTITFYFQSLVPASCSLKRMATDARLRKFRTSAPVSPLSLWAKAGHRNVNLGHTRFIV
jgi:DNA-binding transcriptional regulator YiaG